MKTGSCTRKLGVMAAFLAIALSACHGSPVRFESEDAPKFDPSKGRAVSAEACGFQLLLFIPIKTNSRAGRAYAALRAQAGPDYLTDVEVQETWTYGLVGTQYCTVMRGTAYPRVTSTN